MHAGSSETLAPLLDEQGVRSDAATTVAAVPARDTDIFTITIESLVPVRGHIIDASRTETVAQLKVRYLKVLQEQAMALHMACANTPSEAPNPTRPPASAQSRRAREMASPTVCPEFETHCRFIFDGIELSDDKFLTELNLGEAPRVLALSTRSKRGLAHRVAHNLMRWWPLIAVALLSCSVVFEVAGLFPGHHPSSRWRCDRPLIVFLIMCVMVILPYGYTLSGLYQEDRGHRLLWFMQSPILTRTMSGAATLGFIWFIIGAVWVFGSDTCRETAPPIYYASLTGWLLLLVLNVPVLVLITLPCMLCAQCPLAFRIISFMSGVQRAVVRVDVDQAMHV
uniref:Uncharacterized protein n=1 Tax=Haptolina ericina TaxID=156174 RepID=A0A7S3AN73_9EUKA